jgi:peptide deformylase
MKNTYKSRSETEIVLKTYFKRLFLVVMFGIISNLNFAQVIFSETFTSNLGQMTAANGSFGNWIFTSTCARSALTGHSASGSAIFSGAGCQFGNGGNTVSGNLTSNSIAIPAAGAVLSFNYGLNNECGTSGTCPYDILSVQVSSNGGASYTSLAGSNSQINANTGWSTYTLSLNAYSGMNVLVRFNFNSGDGIGNAYDGVYVDDITVTSNCTPPTVNASASSTVLCSGNNVVLNATGATTYTWMPGNIVSSSATVTPLASTIYTVTGKTGCSTTKTISIVVNPTPTISLSGAAICFGQSFTLNPSGASTYTYSSGSAVVTPTTTTSYTVTGTSAQGCVSPAGAVATITVNSLPVITVISGSICQGQNFTLTPGGASTYTYSSGSAVVTPTITSAYTVMGTSAQGCVSALSATSNITVNSNPIITVSNAAICQGQSFTLAPSGASTYTYSSGSAVVTPTVTSSYTITGTSALGCVSVSGAVATVTVNNKPVITISNGTICSGQSFTLSPSGASTYTYSSGSPVVSPTVTSAYTVMGTSAQGCVSALSATSNVTVNNNPIISVSNGVICQGQNFTLIPSGASTYTYSSGSAVVSPTVTSNYTVTGTSAQGCLSVSGAVATVTVNINPTISVGSGAICQGQNFTLIPSGASTYTYSSGSALVSPTTTSSYTVTGTSAQGCVSVSGGVATVTVNANPVVTVGNGVICEGQSFTLNPSGASTYTFSNGNAVVSPSVTSSYTVTGTSAQGCVSVSGAVATVSVNANPVITVGNGTICEGQSFTLNPSGASTYTYSNGNAVVSPSVTSSYTVTGTSNDGCVSVLGAVSTVTVNNNPIILIGDGSICEGQSFTLNPSGASTYTYSSGNALVTPSVTSTYTVTGTSAEGCVSVSGAVATVTVSANPVVTVGNGVICEGQSFTLNPSGASTYTFSNGNAVVSPSVTSSYTVTGTSAQGCVSVSGAVATVSVNANPVITVGNGAICEGQSFTLNPSGASTYTYSSGNAVVSPSVTSSYTVTGTSNEGCVSVLGSVSTVTVNTNPIILVSDTSICEGQSFTINPNGASTYTFSSGNAIVTPSITSSYTVTGTSLEGCVSVSGAVMTITVNANPIITISDTLICEGQSVTLNPIGASSYTYSSGNALVTPSVTSSYTVTGASAEGCLSNAVVATVSVNALPLITFTASDDTICVNGSSIILSGLPAGGNYSGSNVTGNLFNPVIVGTFSPMYNYTDTITGCSNSASVSIVVDPCTGVRESQINAVGITIYPNPTSGLFTIETPNNDVKTITMFDMTGRVILSINTIDKNIKVDVSNYAKGIYYVSTKTTYGTEVIKVVLD